VSLLGYFGHDGYKLLDKSTGAVFRSQDIIFKEEITHIAKQPNLIIFNKENDLFWPSLELKTETKQESAPENSNPNLGPNSDPLYVMNIELDYNYYQPWSDNEWLVDEMLVMLDEDITMQ